MLLIGIKKSSTSCQSYSSEGYYGSNIESTNFDIIKEGSKEDLLDYINKTRLKAKKGHKTLESLEKLQEEYFGHYQDYPLSREEEQKLEDEALEQIRIDKYDKVIIIEGMIV